MCGISGLWGKSTERSIVEQLMGQLVHRGPDASGLFENDRGVLGHRRLSIMDPGQGGNQPIYAEDGKRAIIANGEMYNYPQLRSQLQKSHKFRTANDSESALHLYEDLGTQTASKIDGMFAFAIADGDDIYLARDPIGIKPLYIGRHGDSMVFASELKALAGRATDVQEFPAGTWYHSKHGTHQYYTVPNLQAESGTATDHARLVRQALERAVLKRMMSDVPVGAFLSGGLDSSIIAAMMRQHVKELHTFSVGVEGSRDLEAARVVSRHLGTIHHEYIITPDEVHQKLPEIIYHLESFDQDLVRSAIPCYFTSRLAAQHVKVILTGEGADELFAGYTYYKDISAQDQLHDELRRSVESLHNVNLQRVDRLTMAHSLEGRVPFLDVEMIEVAQKVPAELKLRPDADGKPVEKWILRKACEDLLPQEIVWRKKEQFDEGSGTVDLLAAGLEKFMTGAEAETYMSKHPSARLRSPEESIYHKMLGEAFGYSPVVMDNVGRWADRPVGTPAMPC